MSLLIDVTGRAHFGSVGTPVEPSDYIPCFHIIQAESAHVSLAVQPQMRRKGSGGTVTLSLYRFWLGLTQEDLETATGPPKLKYIRARLDDSKRIVVKAKTLSTKTIFSATLMSLVSKCTLGLRLTHRPPSRTPRSPALCTSSVLDCMLKIIFIRQVVVLSAAA
ncbi:hypothetical protein TMatcc_004515 [Talaromyces marneffei ATCC 18224]